jgi:predicted DsbA family dithiol-disulfide isomerase
VGLDRSALLRELGIDVVTLPLEIHPEIPVGGLSLAERWGARYAEALSMYERIEAECAAAGLAFRRPARVPNTRRALATAEWVRQHQPDAFVGVERLLFETHFIDNRPLDDPDVVDEVVAAGGAEAAEARRAFEAGELEGDVRAAHALAGTLGVRATPTWLLARRLIMSGARPRDVFRDAVDRKSVV